jgi:hypothetical protein
MAWYLQTVVRGRGSWSALAFLRKEVYYPFSKTTPQMRMPTWLARTVTAVNSHANAEEKH